MKIFVSGATGVIGSAVGVNRRSKVRAFGMPVVWTRGSDLMPHR